MLTTYLHWVVVQEHFWHHFFCVHVQGKVLIENDQVQLRLIPGCQRLRSVAIVVPLNKESTRMMSASARHSHYTKTSYPEMELYLRPASDVRKDKMTVGVSQSI